MYNAAVETTSLSSTLTLKTELAIKVTTIFGQGLKVRDFSLITSAIGVGKVDDSAISTQNLIFMSDNVDGVGTKKFLRKEVFTYMTSARFHPSPPPARNCSIDTSTPLFSPRPPHLLTSYANAPC